MQLPSDALAELHRQQQHALDTIKSKNLVTVTVAKEGLPIQQQANPEFTTLENLHKRSQLTLDAELEKVFSLLWSLPELKKSRDGSQLTKEGYFKIMRSLHLALQTRRKRTDVDKLIAQDYDDDLAKFGELNKQNFCQSLFELVDTWCNSLERELYTAFSWALVINIVDPMTGALRKGKIRCILDDPEEEMLSLWREGNQHRRVDGLRMDILLRVPEVVNRLKHRKKGRILTTSDSKQLKAISQKMGLAYGDHDADHHPTQYAFANHPEPIPDVMLTEQSHGDIVAPEEHEQVIESTEQPETVSTILTSTAHGDEVMSPHTSVSSVPLSLQQQYCPAIVITRPISAPALKRSSQREILHIQEPQRQHHVKQRVKQLPRNSCSRRPGRKNISSLYLLQRHQLVTKQPLPRNPRMVHAVANELRLGPARKLYEDASAATVAQCDKSRRSASVPLLLHRPYRHGDAQLPSSLTYYYSQYSEGSQLDGEHAGEASNATSKDSQEDLPFVSQSSHPNKLTWLKIRPGSQQPILVTEEEMAEHQPIITQSTPNLHGGKVSELVGSKLLSKECTDLPQRRKKRRKRKSRMHRSIDPLVISARNAEQQLALQQWYCSKDYRRLY